MSAIPAKNRAIVATRSGGVCEGCGLRRATDVHHRQYRSRGGTHAVSNLLALCGGAGGLPGGNHTGCHGVAHSGHKGEALGWAIRSNYDPLLVPKFRTFDATWWRFDNDGGKEQINPIDAKEYLELIGAIREGVIQ